MISAYIDKNIEEDKRIDTLRKIYQLFILHELFDSKHRKKLVLRGLSAAYFAYGLSEGAENLELVTLKEIKMEELRAVFESISNKFKTLSIDSIEEKRYSNLINVIIADGNYDIKLPVLVTKITYDWKRKSHFEVRSFESSHWAFSVIGQVVNLNEIIKDNSNLEVFKNIRFNSAV